MVVNDTIICMWIRGRGEAFRWKPNQLVMRLTTRLLSTVQEKVMKCNGCKGTIHTGQSRVKELTGLGTKLCVNNRRIQRSDLCKRDY